MANLSKFFVVFSSSTFLYALDKDALEGHLCQTVNSGAILHKIANQRKVSSLLKLLWAALQVETQKRKLGVSLVCHGCNVF